jgi:hypothetical protein
MAPSPPRQPTEVRSPTAAQAAIGRPSGLVNASRLRIVPRLAICS